MKKFVKLFYTGVALIVVPVAITDSILIAITTLGAFVIAHAAIAGLAAVINS